MRILLAVLLSFIPFSVHAEYLGDLSANPYAPLRDWKKLVFFNQCAIPMGWWDMMKRNGLCNLR